jgi:DNA-binding Lrp family transcriptional regulator
MPEYNIDDTDLRIVIALRANPRATVSDLSRRLSLARGTVHTRLDRLHQRGVITGFGPDLNLAASGFPVRAFTTLSIAQGQHEAVINALKAVPHILEVHTVTGPGDLLLRLAAETNDHLHRLLQEVAAIPEVSHATTHLALASPIMKSGADLLVELAEAGER